ASNTVTVSSDSEGGLSISKTISQGLQLAKNPLHWAKEHGFTTLTSFTKAALANRFLITISSTPEGCFNREIHTTAKALRYFIGNPTMMSQQIPPFLSNFCFFFNYFTRRGRTEPQEDLHSKLGQLRGQLNPSKEAIQEQNGIEAAITVVCLSRKMVVQVKKDILQRLEFMPAEVSLRDPGCRATSNSSHFLLESLLTSCGTAVGFGSGPSVLCHNAMCFIQCIAVAGSSPTPSFWHELHSGNNGFSPLVQFSCVYPVLAPPDLDPGSKMSQSLQAGLNPSSKASRDLQLFSDMQFRVSSVLFSLDLYCSDVFLQRSPSPAIIPINSHIFVQASMAATNSRFSFLIQKCFVSPSSNPEEVPVYPIIEQACPREDSVTFYSSVDNGLPLAEASRHRHRFSFVLRPLYNSSIQFLHCQLVACRKENTGVKGHTKIPMCISLDEACAGNGDTEWDVDPGNLRRTISKPMIVTIEGEKQVLEHRRPMKQVPVAIYQGTDIPVVVGIAFAAFLIGVLFAGALWYIYSRTGKLSASDSLP
uniref:ZP domain-containing protein n=1 Tax=Latimeria chalumnae TaxID=7897 RepID=H3A6W0_LATCH